jgi:CheY-like chemotaxis protein
MSTTPTSAPSPAEVAIVAAVEQAVLVTSRAGAGKRLKRLLDLLTESGVAVTVVDNTQDAASRLLGLAPPAPPCVFIDAGDVTDAPSLSEVLGRMRLIAESVPGVSPVLVAPDPPPSLVIAGWRAGGGDFLDLSAESGVGVRALLDRVAKRAHERNAERETVATLREMLEEFLRDLVKTERRSIDLEHQLARQARGDGHAPRDLDENREPVVFIIEDDRDVTDSLVESLEEAGLVTFAFLSGEEAQQQAERLAGRGEAIDLALVDSRLPGIDGLETIRRLRQAKPGLAAFLMTGFSDPETAAAAADLGVVGYVLKPFDDVGMLVARIREQAVLAMSRTREHHYLQRIKERHERVLLRYRKLAAEIDH